MRPATPTRERTGILHMPEMLYQSAYVWIVFLSTLDVVLTGMILRYGGEPGIDPTLEINPIARAVIIRWEMLGASIFKFSLVMLVIVLAETVGRAQPKTGKWLIRVCVALSAVPVIWSLSLLFIHRMNFFDSAMGIEGAMMTGLNP